MKSKEETRENSKTKPTKKQDYKRQISSRDIARNYEIYRHKKLQNGTMRRNRRRYERSRFRRGEA